MHGGPDKVVYAYPSEHYEYWHAELPSVGFPWGVFGESFTTEGLLESAVYIGDQLRIGSAEFIVTQPRMPCFKLGMHFDRPDMVKRFLRSRRTGFYLRVSKEGDVAAGDTLTMTSSDPDALTVAEIVRFHLDRGALDDGDQDLLRRASTLTALSVWWRDEFRKRLRALDA